MNRNISELTKITRKFQGKTIYPALERDRQLYDSFLQPLTIFVLESFKQKNS